MKRKRIIIPAIVLVIAAVAVVIMLVSADKNPGDDHQPADNKPTQAVQTIAPEILSGQKHSQSTAASPSLEPVEKEIEQKIKALGFSSGKAQYAEKTEDYWGRELNYCMDESFEYAVTEDGRIMSGRLKNDLLNQLNTDELQPLTQDEYIELAKEYLAICLPAFELAYTSFECTIEEDPRMKRAVTVSIDEWQGDCLVNSGLIDLAKDGTLVYFGGTGNSMEDFEGDYMSKEEVRELAYEMLAEEGASKDAIEFTVMHIEKWGDVITWQAEAEVKTKAETDPFSNFHYYILDAKTGEVLAKY